jgi:hypothetical protein
MQTIDEEQTIDGVELDLLKRASARISEILPRSASSMKGRRATEAVDHTFLESLYATSVLSQASAVFRGLGLAT